MRALLIVSLSLVLGCSPRGAISEFPNAALVGKVRNIYVGTTRRMIVGGDFGSKRSANLTYHRYDISVPPMRETGEVSWPKGDPDPQTDFLTTSANNFNGSSSFITDLARSLRKHARGDREVVVFVHGFNTNFAEGLYRFAQLSHDMELSNPSIHYSWPSLGNPLGYEYDRDSALFARDGLENLLKSVKAAGAEKILLVGHSMGALLTVETIRQMSISNGPALNDMLGGVILISPDIDVELFRQQARRLKPMPQPFVIFTSQKDRALRLSALLTGRNERLGNVSDINELANLEVTLIDVTKFSDNFVGHFTEATSPALVKILKRLNNVEATFQNDSSGRAGLLPGTILRIRKATQVILTPATALTP